MLENSADQPVAKVSSGDLVIFFNHRGDTMRQLVRSLSLPDGSAGAKPIVDTVCLTEYDAALSLPVGFPAEPERSTLTEVFAEARMPNFKITESERFRHLTYFFDGGSEAQHQFEQQILVPSRKTGRVLDSPNPKALRSPTKYFAASKRPREESLW